MNRKEKLQIELLKSRVMELEDNLENYFEIETKRLKYKRKNKKAKNIINTFFYIAIGLLLVTFVEGIMFYILLAMLYLTLVNQVL